MNLLNLKELTMEVSVAAKEAAEYILNESAGFNQGRLEYKSAHDLVSYVDRNTESMLKRKLEAILPGTGFMGEESTQVESINGYQWVVDPLDGTTNFIHGLPVYCVSIALMKGNEVLSGVVLEIGRMECFYAWAGGGAFLNGQPIRVSSADKVSSSLFATGFPTGDYPKIKEILDVFAYCIGETRGIRRLGSAAADLAYVACGRLDGFYEYALNPWDVAGGVILVKEAGGLVGDFSGKGNFVFGKEIFASTPRIYSEFLSLLKQKLSA